MWIFCSNVALECAAEHFKLYNFNSINFVFKKEVRL